MNNVRVTIDEEEYLALKEAKKAVEGNMVCITSYVYSSMGFSVQVLYTGKDETIKNTIEVVTNKYEEEIKNIKVEYEKVNQELKRVQNKWYYNLLFSKEK